MSPKVVVVGSINADLFLQVQQHPKPGETILGTGGHVSAGGKGANQACAAALLGAQVQLIGAVGDDSNAEPALGVLTKSNVDLSAVTRLTDVPTGLAVVTLDQAAENSIVIVAGANGHVTGDFVGEHADAVVGADVVVLQGEVPQSANEAAAKLTAGRLIVNLAPVIGVSAELLAKCDPLIVNEHEAVQLLTDLGNDVVDPDDFDALGAQLLDFGPKSVMITLGSAGSKIFTPGQTVSVAATKVKAVDTTGAGDAFVGGVAHRLASGDDLVSAAKFASRVGAYAVQSYGAQNSYPTATDTLP